MLRAMVVNAALIGMVVASSLVNCPIDDSGAYFTGVTKTDVSGKFLKQYRCNLYSHVFWSTS
jgi:hypothetical protein